MDETSDVEGGGSRMPGLWEPLGLPDHADCKTKAALTPPPGRQGNANGRPCCNLCGLSSRLFNRLCGFLGFGNHLKGKEEINNAFLLIKCARS